MGLFSFVDDVLGTDFTGKEAGRAAAKAGDIQAEAAREAQQLLGQVLHPFRVHGTTASHQLLGSVLQPDQLAAYQAPEVMTVPEAARVTTQDIMSDPAFGALAAQQEEQLLRERAGLGLAGSGGSQDMLQRNLFRLSEDFRTRRQAEELARQQQQFGQGLAASQLAQQQQAQQFGQEAGANLQRFNQLLNMADMGQQAATTIGTQGANLLTGAGTAQSIAPLARAQARGQGISGLMGLAGTLGGAALGGPLGAAAGGAVGSSLGGGMASNWFNL